MRMTGLTMSREAARVVLVTSVCLTLGSVASGQPPARTEPEVDIFLKVDGVDGETTDRDHPGWIDVDSFSYSMSRPADSSGAASHKGLTLTRRVDKASPYLYLHCSSGRPLAKVVLEITHTADDDISIQEFQLHNAIVTSVHASAASGAKRATERVTLHYESIVWTYVKVDPVTGSVISEVTMQWDTTEDDGS